MQIWINTNNVESFDITQVGWCHKNLDHLTHSTVCDNIRNLLPDNIQGLVQARIQIIHYYLNKNVSTRAFVIEIDKKLSREYDTKVFESLNATKHMTLILMNNSYDTNGTIKVYFYNWNTMLKYKFESTI